MPIQPYILPASTEALPGEITLTQFIQTILTGISGLPGPMVRPKWQVEPPKNPPSITTNWIAFGIDISSPDANSYVWSNSGEGGLSVSSQRHEAVDIGCSIYGPEALEYFGLLRDGFQVPQNLQALTAANMGFVEILPGRKIPDLVNERFYNRVETSIILRREVLRSYSVPTVLSSTGVIHVPVSGDEEYTLAWDTENEEN